MNVHEDSNMRLIKLQEVIEQTGLGRSTIYKYMSEGRFPASVSVGVGAVRWADSEVQEWILARIEERDLNKPVFSARAVA